MNDHEQSTGERAVADRLAEAEKVLEAARAAEDTARRRYDNDKMEAERAARIAVDEKHRATLAERARERREARQVVDDLRVLHAQQGNAANLLPGTKVRRMVRVRQHSWSREFHDEPRLGIVEVVTRETDHSENMADWRRAQVGEVVVRFVNAKGKRMKGYERHPVLLRAGEAEPESARTMGRSAWREMVADSAS